MINNYCHQAGHAHLILLIAVVTEDLPNQRAPDQLGVPMFDLRRELNKKSSAAQTQGWCPERTCCVCLKNTKMLLVVL